MGLCISRYKNKSTTQRDSKPIDFDYHTPIDHICQIDLDSPYFDTPRGKNAKERFSGSLHTNPGSIGSELCSSDNSPPTMPVNEIECSKKSANFYRSQRRI